VIAYNWYLSTAILLARKRETVGGGAWLFFSERIRLFVSMYFSEFMKSLFDLFEPGICFRKKWGVPVGQNFPVSGDYIPAVVLNTYIIEVIILRVGR
jgi:hypothetical protein